jgi:hypothetical protein
VFHQRDSGDLSVGRDMGVGCDLQAERSLLSQTSSARFENLSSIGPTQDLTEHLWSSRPRFTTRRHSISEI